MSKKLTQFLDLFMKYCEYFPAKEEAAKIYNYFLEKSEFIAATMQCNETLKEGYFMQVRCLLQEMEVDIFKNDIPIYFVECPYGKNVHRVSFMDFLKDSRKFYVHKGHLCRNEVESVRLEFDSRILSVLFEKNKSSDLSSPRFWGNNHNQRQDELYALVKSDGEKILETHGKSFRDLTKEEFRRYIETVLNQKDSQHIIDHLWYALRND